MDGTPDKVRIGFAGVGNMGQAAHLRNYADLPNCEVVALSEVRPGLRAAVARKYGIARTYASAEEMVATEKLDGIVASQPFQRHPGIIAPLYKAGIPIFTEKPLSGTLASAEWMLGELAQSGTWHMVGYHKRSDPATEYAKAEIDRLKVSGELGPMKYVRLTMPEGDWIAAGFRELVRAPEGDDSYPPPPADDAPQEPPDPEYISFVNYYIHQVNLLRHLMGEAYTVTHADPAGVLFVARGVESGISGIIEMSPYRTTIDWQESALVAFQKGFVKLELPAPLAYNRPGRVEVYADPGNGATPLATVPQLPWTHAMRHQAENFIAAIKGELRPPCEAAEALEDLKMARDYMALFRAAKG